MDIFTINAKASGTVTNQATASIALTGQDNADGSKPTMLRLRRIKSYADGTVSSFIVQHSADGTTWATLWDTSALAGDEEKWIYSWNPYLRAYFSFTSNGTEKDPGFRASVEATPFGLPDWRAVKPCRSEHLRMILPSIVNTDLNFEAEYPAQAGAAKRDLEAILRGRGFRPERLFTDGDRSEPCIPGLQMAGAWKTLWYVLLDAGVTRDEGWKADLAMVAEKFAESFEAGMASGLIIHDSDLDGVPSDEEEVRQTIQFLR